MMGKTPRVQVVSMRQRSSNRAWKVSLPFMLILPFVLQVGGVVGVVGYLSYRHAQQSVENLTNQLMDSTSQRLEQQLVSYLAPAQLVNQMNSDAVKRGALKLDLAKVDRQRDQYLWQNMQQFKDLMWISLGAETKDAMGIVRPEQQTRLQISVSNQATQYFGRYYQVDEQGRRQQLIKVQNRKPFNPRTRPWYKQAVQAKGAVWTDIYTGFTPGRILISAAQPLYDRQGKLQGVSSADISLFDLKHFLVSHPVSASGQIFLMDRSGRLIASSNQDEQAFQMVHTEPKPQRVSVFDRPETRMAAAAQALKLQFQDFRQIQPRSRVRINWQGQPQFVQALPLFQREKLGQGLDWIIVTVIPESDVMGEINAGRQMTIGLCLAAAVAVIGLNMLLSRLLTNPIRRLSQASQQITQGHPSHWLPSSQIQELSILTDSFNQMSQEIQQSRQQLQEYSRSLEQKVTERTHELQVEIQQRLQAEEALQEANQELRRLAFLDGLTQIPNRRWFDQRFMQEWARLKREGNSLSVILCDVDYFKQYNDTYGHQTGDDCLRDIARALSIAARRPSDLVARYGGEEFVVLLPNTDLAGAMEVAQAMRSFIHELKIPHRKSSISNLVTMSFGIASVVPTDAMMPEHILIDADRGLYQAKEDGRDRVAIG
jgi:diguanylate cyclase (GGDEF)-like protein